MFMRNKVWVVIVICILAVGGIIGINGLTSDAVSSKADDTSPDNEKVKNVIVLIGDGMGPSYTTAYRYMKDNPSTQQMEETVFDQYLTGMAKTYSNDKDENVTDSAAAATAMAAGIKTYNGAISVDKNEQPVETVLEAAKKNGKSTGLVSTSQITHATPGAFGAHNESRDNYDEIADDYYDEMIDGKHKIDVMLGGGVDNFDRDDRNLINEFKNDGYHYVTTAEDMNNNKNARLLGLFAQVGMKKAIDREPSTPSLAEMTNAALKQLNKNEDGFFLMVEGSQIDWGGHDNDAVSVMSEMDDFAKAFQAAIAYAKEHGDTQVIMTADHSTGGLSIGRDGDYNFDTEVIKAAKRTPEYMAEQIIDGASVEYILNKYVTFDLTDTELTDVKKAAATEDVDTLHQAISDVFNERAGIGFTTGGHTGVDVPVYAYGPHSERFSGLIENTDIANEVFTFVR